MFARNIELSSEDNAILINALDAFVEAWRNEITKDPSLSESGNWSIQKALVLQARLNNRVV